MANLRICAKELCAAPIKPKARMILKKSRFITDVVKGIKATNCQLSKMRKEFQTFCEV